MEPENEDPDHELNDLMSLPLRKERHQDPPSSETTTI